MAVGSVFTRDTRFVDVFNTGRARARWVARTSHDWVRLSRAAGDLGEDAVFPTTAPGVEPTRVAARAPVLEYRLHLFKPVQVTVKCYLLPTQPLQAGRGLRYAVGLDDEPPQFVSVGAGVEVSSGPWAQGVLNAAVAGSTTHEVAAAGPHVLKIYMVDAGVVLDKIVVDAGGVRPSYLGPPETRVATGQGISPRPARLPARTARRRRPRG